MLPRVHFFEIHEQPWLSNSIRQGVTDGLFTVWKTFFWENTIPHLNDLLDKSDTQTIVDLCSGSGGPLPLAADTLQEKHHHLKVFLTDLYPNKSWINPVQGKAHIQYHQASVNAQDVPKDLKGLRTLFEAFHHFRPDGAVAILKDAVAQKQPIAIFEFQKRDVLDTLFSPLLLILPVSIILSCIQKPFSWSKLFWTIVPVIPFILIFDGIVSVLRTYSTDELADLAQQAGSDGFRWEVRETRDRGFGRMTCLVGWPDSDDGVFHVSYPPQEK